MLTVSGPGEAAEAVPTPDAMSAMNNERRAIKTGNGMTSRQVSPIAPHDRINEI